MAYQEYFKMSIQDESGNYYSASMDAFGIWTVPPPTPTPVYLQTLPDGWTDTSITWERDLSYLGIFRSMTNSNYKFSLDARAIITYIRSQQGIKGFGDLTIWIINQMDSNYSIFYKSQLNFQTYHDFAQTELLEIGTLDSGLIRDLHAYGDTDFNIPIWQLVSGAWIPYHANEWILHNGIKLLYNATYVSAASTSSKWDPGGIEGFNQGRHATSGVNMGVHTLPALAQFNVVQNNGTTTYIGNDILNNLLLQGNQNPGASNLGGINELNFSGPNESKPYTRNNFSLKNACPLPPNTFDMSVAVSGTFSNTTVTYNDNGHPVFIGFVLFEIDDFDNPITVAGRYTYQLIYQVTMPAGGSPYTFPSQDFSNYTTPVTVTINPNKVYVFGIIYDEATPGGGLTGDGSKFAVFGFSALQFSIFSKYDYGASGVPIPAPQLNPSVFAGYRLHQLWEMLVPFLATTQTDSNGFPIPVVTDYEGTSDFLSNPSLDPIGDVVPYQIIISSDYCIHDLQGQSYVTISAHKVFDYCKKQLGCGMGVIYDTDSVAVGLKIEDLIYFFPDCTNPANMIYDFGYDISDFEILQGGAELGLGANLKLGYTKADTNSDFGVDAFNTELFFNTPISEVPGTMDYEETSILTEQYAIEKTRAQKVNQPIGSSFDPANPSSGNRAVAFYCEPSATIGPFYPVNPDNIPLIQSPYAVEQYSSAQNSDPSASSAPYVNGLYYPDSAINLKLSPCRALERGTGQLIHSLMDKMDSDYLTFRNTYIMQYNNQTLALSGIASKLDVGTATPAITEMSDKLIGNLPAKLFLPITVKWKSSSVRELTPVMNGRPGYVRLFTKNKGYGYTERKVYLSKATQNPTPQGNVVSEFEGWLTPDQVI